MSVPHEFQNRNDTLWCQSIAHYLSALCRIEVRAVSDWLATKDVRFKQAIHETLKRIIGTCAACEEAPIRLDYCPWLSSLAFWLAAADPAPWEWFSRLDLLKGQFNTVSFESDSGVYGEKCRALKDALIGSAGVFTIVARHKNPPHGTTIESASLDDNSLTILFKRDIDFGNSALWGGSRSGKLYRAVDKLKAVNSVLNVEFRKMDESYCAIFTIL